LVVRVRWAIQNKPNQEYTLELAGWRFYDYAAGGEVWPLVYMEDNREKSWIEIRTKAICPLTLFNRLSALGRKIVSVVDDLTDQSEGRTKTIDGGVASALKIVF
jgi:hypothetical protein